MEFLCLDNWTTGSYFTSESADARHTFKLFFVTTRLLQRALKVIATQDKHGSRG